MSDSPKAKPTAAVPAAVFHKFRELPPELRLDIWDMYLEASGPRRHCFNMRTFGRTYAVMDLAQNTLQTVDTATDKDPDHRWVDPLFRLLEQNKVLLSGSHYLASPTVSLISAWNGVESVWMKAPAPLYAYVNLKTDIFLFGSSVGSAKFLRYLTGQDTGQHIWVKGVRNLAIRLPQSALMSPRDAMLVSEIGRLARWAFSLRVFYLVVDPVSMFCRLGPPHLWLRGAGVAIDETTGFIDFDEYCRVHQLEAIRRGLPRPGNTCKCFIEEGQATDLVADVWRLLDPWYQIRRFDIKVVVDAPELGVRLPTRRSGA